MKKVIIGIATILFMNSWGFCAVLSLSPMEGYISKNCIEEFQVILDLDEGEQTITMDLEMDSNMKFIGFEKSDMFQYASPAHIDGNDIKLMLFNTQGLNVSQGGVVGVLYYDTTAVNDPYLNFVFRGKGNTTETNVNIKGRDILSYVRSGKFILSDLVECSHPVYDGVSVGDDYDIESFVADFKADHWSDKYKIFIMENKRYILGCVVLLVLIALFVPRFVRHDKK